MTAYFTDHFNYTVVVVLMMVGLYVVFASRNKIKKLVGLSVFQTSVFLFYITLGKVAGGQPPILEPQDQLTEKIAAAAPIGDIIVSGEPGVYSNPLPHVLILTAIVVGVATLAVGLALVVRIREVYGTIEDAKIDELDYLYNLEGTDDPARAVSA